MLSVLFLSYISCYLSIPLCKAVPFTANSVQTISEFETLCFRINSFTVWDFFYIFSSVRINISSLDQPFVYSIQKSREVNSSEIISSFFLGIFGKNKFSRVKDASFTLNPYDTSVIMVENGYGDNRIRVETKFIPIDYNQAICFISLFLILYYSRAIVRCSLFYYIIGLIMGIFLSSIFLAYLLYVFYSKTGFIAGFMTKLVYLSLGIVFSLCLKHFWFLISAYPVIFVSYAGITSFMSLATVYYFGPVKEPKIQNILIFSLRIGSLISIMVLSNHFLLTASWILFLLIFLSLKHLRLKSLYSKIYRKSATLKEPRKLLTVNEYEKLGKSYTEKALEDLREQLGGEGSSVKKLAKLKDPLRVLKFVGGSEHLSENELSYRSDILNASFLSDDDENYDENPYYDPYDK